MPNLIPSQPTGYYRPPMLMMGEIFQHARMQRPMQASNLPMPLVNQIPRIGESIPIFDPPGFRHDNSGPRWDQNTRTDQKKVRPSQLQKLCKAFDKSKYPYDHVARFCQVLFEDVDDVHTMVQGFGLPLKGKELSWFQSLSNSVLYDFEVLIIAFIKENTKTRIKCNTIKKILYFKKK